MSLETPRLRLRILDEGDVDALHAVWGDPGNMRHWPRPYARDEVLARLRQHADLHRERGLGLLAIVHRATGEVIGACGLVPQVFDGRDELEVSYHLARPWQGQGFATEAARAVLAAAGPRRVVAAVRPVNVPSVRVAERLGMRPEGIFDWKGMPHVLYVRQGARPGDVENTRT